MCFQCNEHRKAARDQGLQLADSTTFMMYAHHKGHDQGGSDMYTYKDRPIREAQGKYFFTESQFRLLALLYQGLLRFPSLSRLKCCVVPSSQGRNHLQIIAQAALSTIDPQLHLHQVLHHNNHQKTRSLDVSSLSSEPVSGDFLLIEDSWVTGGSTQSAAAKLKQMGAGRVDVLAIARLVSDEDIERLEI